MRKKLSRELSREEGRQMLPRLRMNSQIRVIYQREGKTFMAYNSRVGRVLMAADADIDGWGSLQLTLWEAMEKLGARYEANCYVKRI